ncbi:hypothetical protein [Vibrio crassostreae]|nr:hypothetical protein [Vibrio crassostreae]TCT60146.1 hypothetical protein EDB31_15414 [Vibrio crassostreae]
MKFAGVSIGKAQWITAGLAVVLMVGLVVLSNKVDVVEDAAKKIGAK